MVNGCFVTNVGQSVGNYCFFPEKDYALYQSDIIHLIKVGLYFDIRIASIAIGSLLLMSAIVVLIPKMYYWWSKFILIISVLCVELVAIAAVVNLFYYMTYRRHIDVFIFGLFDDDTTAILSTIWQDYPIIWGLVGIICSTYLFYWLFKRWQIWVITHIKRHYSHLINTAVLVIAFAGVTLGARGSVVTFPLRQADAQISTHPMINMCAPNGIIAMDWAYKGYKFNDQFTVIP